MLYQVSQKMRCILLFLISIVLSVPAQAYDLHGKLRASLANNNVVGFQTYFQDSQVSFQGVFADVEEQEFILDETLSALKRAQRAIGTAPDGCYQRDVHLQVYFAPDEIINNREIMSFLDWEKWDNKNIFGVFDSQTADTGTVTIFVSSSHSLQEIKQTIAHEVYHYSQFKNCMPLSEDDAYAFENMLMV